MTRSAAVAERELFALWDFVQCRLPPGSTPLLRFAVARVDTRPVSEGACSVFPGETAAVSVRVQLSNGEHTTLILGKRGEELATLMIKANCCAVMFHLGAVEAAPAHLLEVVAAARRVFGA